MGTNFYIHEASIEVATGEAVVEKTHIGKRSGGWVFGFQGEDCKTVQEWKDRLFNLPSNQQIVDEYGTPMTPQEMWDAIEATKLPWGPNKLTPHSRKTYKPEKRYGRNISQTVQVSDRDWGDEGFDFYSGEFC